MTWISWRTWAGLTAFAVLSVGLALVAAPAWRKAGPLPAAAPVIGGPFALTTHDGRRLTDKDLLGQPFAIFFGFTHCPDICPTSLLDLSVVIERLGRDAEKMRFLFVSIDPERDTPEQLKLYLSSFNPRITGLTGTLDDVRAAAKAYRAYWQRVPTSDGYTMNHSTFTYLVDRHGKYDSLIAYQQPADAQAAVMRRVIAAP